MASPWLLETLTRCPQMGSSCGSPRPICPVLATTHVSLATPWGRRPNIPSSASWVSAGPPLVTGCCRRELQVSTIKHCFSFCHSKSDSKNKQSDSQISIATPARDQVFCTQSFLVTVHAQTVTLFLWEQEKKVSHPRSSYAKSPHPHHQNQEDFG